MSGETERQHIGLDVAREGPRAPTLEKSTPDGISSAFAIRVIRRLLASRFGRAALGVGGLLALGAVTSGPKDAGCTPEDSFGQEQASDNPALRDVVGKADLTSTKLDFVPTPGMVVTVTVPSIGFEQEIDLGDPFNTTVYFPRPLGPSDTVKIANGGLTIEMDPPADEAAPEEPFVASGRGAVPVEAAPQFGNGEENEG